MTMTERQTKTNEIRDAVAAELVTRTVHELRIIARAIGMQYTTGLKKAGYVHRIATRFANTVAHDLGYFAPHNPF